MNTLILYDSMFGNTERLARVMADRLDTYGTVRLFRVTEDAEFEMRQTDLLIVGGPTQRHGTSVIMRAFLDGLPRQSLHGLRAAVFDTRYHMATWKSGTATSRIASRLKRAGASLIMPPESFFVVRREGPLEQGEALRAGHWAEQIYTTLEAIKSTEQHRVEIL